MTESSYQAIAVQEFREGEGLYIRSFFADSDFNMNQWGVTPQSLKRDIASGLQKSYNGKTAPIIMTPDYGHPPANIPNMLEVQEQFRVGDFLRTGIDPNNGRAYVDALIYNPEAIELIQNGQLNFVSPSIKSLSEIHYGDGKIAVTKFTVNHLALVQNPAYGTMKAQIKGRCTGNGEECLRQLTNVQASLNESVMVEKLACGGLSIHIASSQVAQPIQEKIENGVQLNPEEIMSMIAEDSTEQIQYDAKKWYEFAPNINADNCVSKWIPELKSAHPTWPQGQVIAVAFSKCGESKKSKNAEGYFWQKNFGATFDLGDNALKQLDNFTFEESKGFLVGDTTVKVYAGVKGHKIAWLSKDHMALHDMCLSHDHCYTIFDKDDNETGHEVYSAKFGSMTQDDTYKSVKRLPGIFVGFAESLKHAGSKTETAMAGEEQKDKDYEELKKEHEATKTKLAETEKEMKDQKEKMATLEATLQAQLRNPLIASIVESKLSLGSIAVADKQAEISKLEKLPVDVLGTMQAEFKNMVATKTATSSSSQKPDSIAVRYAYSAEVDTEKPGKNLLEAIRSRQR